MAPVTARQGSVCAAQDLKGSPVTSVLQATSTTLCASVSICPARAWLGTQPESSGRGLKDWKAVLGNMCHGQRLMV